MSRGNSKRAEIIEGLTTEFRKSSAGSVLLSQSVADAVGVNSTDLECLDILQMSGPMTAGSLAEITGLTTGAITGVIDRLEKKGLAERAKDLEDRRRVIVQTVAEGVKKLEPYYEWVQEAVDAIYEKYNDEELALVLEFMKRMNDAAQAGIARLREGPGQVPGVAAGRQEGKHFSASLGNVRRGSLVFENGTTRLTIRAGDDREELYHAHFEHPIPEVKVQGGNVSMKYTGIPFLTFREKPAEVILNRRIPWKVEIKVGASRLNADLRGLDLTSFEIHWGVSGATIALPRPEGTVPVKISGGASNVTISRPRGVPVRVYVHPGGKNLRLDGERFSETESKRWESAGYGRAKDRYEIEVAFGAKDLVVEEQ